MLRRMHYSTEFAGLIDASLMSALHVRGKPKGNSYTMTFRDISKQADCHCALVKDLAKLGSCFISKFEEKMRERKDEKGRKNVDSYCLKGYWRYLASEASQHRSVGQLGAT